MKDEVANLAYAVGWGTVRRMPGPVARATFRTIADQAWLRHGPSVQQLEKNLRRVVPAASTRELRLLSRESMRSYLRYWCEVFRLPDLSHDEIVRAVQCAGEDKIVDGLARGKGVVISLPHMANWDHAGAWVTLAHAPLTTVAERLKPESLYERFLDYRRELGMEVLPLTGGPPPFRTLLERARQGRLVCLVGDRDLTENGVPVEFFGEPTSMPPGPAAIAVATGADLLPATLWYEGPRLHIRIHDAVQIPVSGSRPEKVASMTQTCADAFASGIAEHPQDWHMLQRMWVGDQRRGLR
jgi:phosphatidylinositol dimannoside acyltransferase